MIFQAMPVLAETVKQKYDKTKMLFGAYHSNYVEHLYFSGFKGIK